MQTILITGATGFLGSAVVVEILQKKLAVDLLLLVRAENTDDGARRIHEALRKFELSEAEIDNISPRNILIGDFSDVAAFSDDRRLDQVTHVINCAAIASFSKNPMIWPINVDGTFAFARRMSKVNTLKRFLHVGTAMACGPNVESPVMESWRFAPHEEHLVPYTASKAAIEIKMREELPNLPLIVARPSIVVGHTRLGCKPSSSIFWVFRLAQALGRFTCSLDEKIDVIPVDYCAETVVALALKEQLTHDLYHISAGANSSCSFGILEKALARGLNIPSIGSNYRRVNAEDIGDLANDFATKIGPCNHRLIVRALRLYAGFAELNFVFDNSRLVKELVAAAPRFETYIGLCAQSTRDVSIQEQMRWDFK